MEYPIKRVTERVLIDGRWKLRIMFQCMVKFGTQCATPMLLMEYPRVGVHTLGVKLGEPETWYSVYIDKVRTDGFVFIELM